MSQILIFGASTVHGVGGENGGWADKLKLYFHQSMYSRDGRGEAHQIYNLGIPGDTAKGLLERMEREIGPRKPERDLVLIISIGTNDAKAVETSDNFFSSAEEYKQTVAEILAAALRYTAKVIGVGFTPVDDSRTNPIRSSYFNSSRIKLFESIYMDACAQKSITHIPIFEKAFSMNWIEYLYTDGLHPNDRGHEWIASQIIPAVEELAGIVRSARPLISE